MTSPSDDAGDADDSRTLCWRDDADDGERARFRTRFLTGLCEEGSTSSDSLDAEARVCSPECFLASFSCLVM